MKIAFDLTPEDYSAAQSLAAQAGVSLPALARARLLSPGISEIPAEIDSASVRVIEAVQADLIRFIQGTIERTAS